MEDWCGWNKPRVKILKGIKGVLLSTCKKPHALQCNPWTFYYTAGHSRPRGCLCWIKLHFLICLSVDIEIPTECLEANVVHYRKVEISAGGGGELEKQVYCWCTSKSVFTSTGAHTTTPVWLVATHYHTSPEFLSALENILASLSSLFWWPTFFLFWFALTGKSSSLPDLATKMN